MAIPLPKEFICSMREMLGDEAEKLFVALDTPAEVSIRLNPAKPAEVFEGESVGWSPMGRYLAERPQFTLDPSMARVSAGRSMVVTLVSVLSLRSTRLCMAVLTMFRRHHLSL